MLGRSPKAMEPIILKSLSVSVDADGLVPSVLLPVAVALSLTRDPKTVDPNAYQSIANVSKIATDLLPRQIGNGTKHNSLRPFAECFEAAFASRGLRLLRGRRRKQPTIQPTIRLWALRWGENGIRVTLKPSGEPSSADGVTGFALPSLEAVCENAAEGLDARLFDFAEKMENLAADQSVARLVGSAADKSDWQQTARKLIDELDGLVKTPASGARAAGDFNSTAHHDS